MTGQVERTLGSLLGRMSKGAGLGRGDAHTLKDLVRRLAIADRPNVDPARSEGAKPE